MIKYSQITFVEYSYKIISLSEYMSLNSLPQAAVDPMRIIPGRAADKITLLHYNDCANLEARDQEPVGGAGRFVTAVKSQKDNNPLVLFSGNIFSPSMMSTFTKGEQMVPVLTMLGTQAAVPGNHDFDHGLDVLSEMREKTKFPWILSNVIDTETGQALGGTKVSHVIDWEGRKIGLVGLVEREWLDTVATLDNDNIDYTDYVDAGAMLAEELKRKGDNEIFSTGVLLYFIFRPPELIQLITRVKRIRNCPSNFNLCVRMRVCDRPHSHEDRQRREAG